MIAEFPDRRALAFPDEPFSAYCKVCWHAVYVLWVTKDDHHKGECPLGHSAAHECEEALNRSHFKAQIETARQAGLLKPEDSTKEPSK